MPTFVNGVQVNHPESYAGTVPSTPEIKVQNQGTTPNGYQQITPLAASTGLTVPAGTTEALVTVEAQPVRMRRDGTAPTASTGVLLPAGSFIRLYGAEIAAARFIQTAAGTATLNVSYSK